MFVQSLDKAFYIVLQTRVRSLVLFIKHMFLSWNSIVFTIGVLVTIAFVTRLN